MTSYFVRLGCKHTFCRTCLNVYVLSVLEPAMRRNAVYLDGANLPRRLPESTPELLANMHVWRMVMRLCCPFGSLRCPICRDAMQGISFVSPTLQGIIDGPLRIALGSNFQRMAEEEPVVDIVNLLNDD